MKKIVMILSVMLFFFGTAFETKACSPVHKPFKKLIEQYNTDYYIAVEGYFMPSTVSEYATKIMITRSSDSSIKVGQGYEIFEYGPFGTNCEIREIKAHIDSALIGEMNTRILIAYKNRSINGKLVTPAFWKAGIDASKDKIESQEFDHNSRQYISHQCLSSKIRKRLFEGNTEPLEWNKAL